MGSAGKGKSFQVEIEKSGKVVWRETPEAEIADTISAFDIQGSMNSWSRTPLEASEEVKGLYTYQIVLGSKGQETFQIVVDHDPDLVLYPETKMCTRKALKVMGPGTAPDREHCWAIKGDSGAKFTLEVMKTPGSVTVTWFKIVEKKKTEDKLPVVDDDDEDAVPAVAATTTTTAAAPAVVMDL